MPGSQKSTFFTSKNEEHNLKHKLLNSFYSSLYLTKNTLQNHIKIKVYGLFGYSNTN